jgi:hypothetical protein
MVQGGLVYLLAELQRQMEEAGWLADVHARLSRVVLGGSSVEKVPENWHII